MGEKGTSEKQRVEMEEMGTTSGNVGGKEKHIYTGLIPRGNWIRGVGTTEAKHTKANTRTEAPTPKIRIHRPDLASREPRRLG